MTDHATSSLTKEDPPDASFVLTAAVHHALGVNFCYMDTSCWQSSILHIVHQLINP